MYYIVFALPFMWYMVFMSHTSVARKCLILWFKIIRSICYVILFLFAIIFISLFYNFRIHQIHILLRTVVGFQYDAPFPICNRVKLFEFIFLNITSHINSMVRIIAYISYGTFVESHWYWSKRNHTLSWISNVT